MNLPQSRRASGIEVVSSTLFGFFIATWANVMVLPIFGYPVTTLHATGIGGIFTLISLVRGWVFRRSFEFLRIKGILP